MAIFFVILIQNNVFFILVEFESDRMSPRESAKNGRIGAQGLNCRIFSNFGLMFEMIIQSGIIFYDSWEITNIFRRIKH